MVLAWLVTIYCFILNLRLCWNFSLVDLETGTVEDFLKFMELNNLCFIYCLTNLIRSVDAKWWWFNLLIKPSDNN
jgi:hypothetical protein